MDFFFKKNRIFFMDERSLRQKLVKKLGDGLIWFPGFVKFHQNDIWGAFDCIFYNGYSVSLIQMTTLTNVSHRRRKIYDIFAGHGVPIPYGMCYIYAWDADLDDFRIIRL